MVLALVAAADVVVEAYLEVKAVAVLNHAAQREEQRCVCTQLARGMIVEAAASGRSLGVQLCQQSSRPADAYPSLSRDVPWRGSASASICASMMLWLTLHWKKFQLRQPMGGESGRAMPLANPAAAGSSSSASRANHVAARAMATAQRPPHSQRPHSHHTEASAQPAVPAPRQLPTPMSPGSGRRIRMQSCGRQAGTLSRVRRRVGQVGMSHPMSTDCSLAPCRPVFRARAPTNHRRPAARGRRPTLPPPLSREPASYPRTAERRGVGTTAS